MRCRADIDGLRNLEHGTAGASRPPPEVERFLLRNAVAASESGPRRDSERSHPTMSWRKIGERGRLPSGLGRSDNVACLARRPSVVGEPTRSAEFFRTPVPHLGRAGAYALSARRRPRREFQIDHSEASAHGHGNRDSGKTGSNRGANSAYRSMVGLAGDHGRSLGRIWRLCDIAGIPEQILRGRAAGLAVLFTMSGGQLRGGQLQSADRRGMVEALTSPAGPAHPARHPADVLLLPQGLLPLVLAVSPRLRGCRATQEVP